MGENPFTQAFAQADFFGQFLFISLYLLSMVSWGIALSRIWQLTAIGKRADQFRKRFDHHLKTPLNVEMALAQEHGDPLATIYHPVRKKILQLLNRNRSDEPSSTPSPGYLTDSDLDLIAFQTSSSAQAQCQLLRRHLNTLSMCVTLAPFLGLLGTVWGILLSFGSLQNQSGVSTQGVLEGLSLALTTTVIGLLIAIAALIGHTLIKQLIEKVDGQIDQFANQLLMSVELSYRQVK